MSHDKPPRESSKVTTPDPKLVEIFDYFFGVDLTQDKHFEGRLELAEYFSELMANSVRKFYADTPLNAEANKTFALVCELLIRNGVELEEKEMDKLEQIIKKGDL